MTRPAADRTDRVIIGVPPRSNCSEDQVAHRDIWIWRPKKTAGPLANPVRVRFAKQKVEHAGITAGKAQLTAICFQHCRRAAGIELAGCARVDAHYVAAVGPRTVGDVPIGMKVSAGPP